MEKTTSKIMEGVKLIFVLLLVGMVLVLLEVEAIAVVVRILINDCL